MLSARKMKGIQMPYTIKVTQDFIDHRESKRELYNQRGRTDRKFLMDLDAEIYEYMMIKEGMWDDDPDWRVDAHIPNPDGAISVDVKFISKYYNLTPTKVCNILQQRDVLHGFMFMEWVQKPSRPLQVGDDVVVRQLGYMSIEDLMDNIKPSTNYKDWGTSHYVNVHKILQKRKGPSD